MAKRIIVASIGLIILLGVGLIALRYTRHSAVVDQITTAPLARPVAKEQKADGLYGQWRVVAIPNASPITAMSGAAAAEMVGKLLVLGPQSIQFVNQTCHPTYESTNESSVQFIQDYKVDPITMNLPNPVTRFDGGCTDLFVRDPNKIIFTWYGYFLEAEKVSAEK